MPYAAAVADTEPPDRTDPVDQGIEHGLATAEATDQADVAYTHQGEPAAAAAPQPAESAGEAAAGFDDDRAAADQRKGSAGKIDSTTQVHACSSLDCVQNCHAVTRFVHVPELLPHHV